MDGLASRAVEIALLGGFFLRPAGQEVVPVSSRKSRAVIAILALSPGMTTTRSSLAALLWGEREEAQARGSLRQALVVLRRELGVWSDRLLKVGSDTIGLDESQVRVDAVEMVRLGQVGTREALAQAAGLYGGAFLSGLDLEEAEFEEWHTRKRAELREAAIRIVDRWQETLDGGDRIAALQQLLGLDPIREVTHLALMRAYAEAGNVGLALRQFEECRRSLRDEVGVEPAPETLALRDEMARSQAVTSRPPRGEAAGSGEHPTVAVLPLDSRDGRPGDDHLGHALSDDIATELACYRSITVIGTVSAANVRALVADPGEAARRLGAGYLVSGGFRRLGDTLVLNIQLLDAAAGVVWAERFFGAASDLLRVESEVVRTIVARIEAGVTGRERSMLKRRPERDWRASDFVLNGRHALDHYEVGPAAEFFKQALARDAKASDAHAYLAMDYVARSWMSGRRNDLAMARAHAVEAVACDRNNFVAHAAVAYVLHYGGELEAAEPHYRRALALNPHDAKLLSYVGAWHAYMGDYGNALELSDRALVRDPHPCPAVWSLRANTLFQLGRDAEAVACIDQTVKLSAWDMPYLVAALARLGDEGAGRLRGAFRQLLAQDFALLERHAAQEPYRLSSPRERLFDGMSLARSMTAPGR